MTFSIWPFLLVLMNIKSGLWMILSQSVFRVDRRIPQWMLAAVATQPLLSAVNALGHIGRDSSALQSPD